LAQTSPVFLRRRAPRYRAKQIPQRLAKQIPRSGLVQRVFEAGYFWDFAGVVAVNLAEPARVDQFPVTRRFAGNDFRIASIDVPDPALRVQKQMV
jgi:hypothetical protein